MASLTRTVKGNVAHFRDIVSEPLTSLKVYFTPVMSGSGQQSPTNVRLFSSITQVTAYHCRKNLFDASAIVRRDGYILDDSGNESSSAASGYLKNLIQVTSGKTYTISGYIAPTKYAWRVYFYDKDKTFLSRTGQIIAPTTYTFVVPNECKYITIQYNIESVLFNTVQIENSYSATEYMPYSCITETLSVDNNVEVYGGYIDMITGEVVATHRAVMLNDPDKWISSTDSGIYGAGNVHYCYNEAFSDRYKDGDSSYTNVDCSYAPFIWNVSPVFMRWTAATSNYIGMYRKNSSYTLDVVKAAAANGDIQICYLLAQPTVIGSITPKVINTFSTANSIWSTMGEETEVSYEVHDTEEIIAKKQMLMSQPHLETATGKMISFSTGTPAPLKTCDITLSIIQRGSGDPSPTNIRPIEEYNNTIINISPSFVGGTQYSIDWQSTVGTVCCGTIDLLNGTFTKTHEYRLYTGAASEDWHVENNNNFYIMTPSTWARNTTASTLYCNLAISYSSVAKGTCRITNSGNFNINIGALIDIHTVAGFKEYLINHPLQVVCQLQTPVVYQIGSQSIKTLYGINNIWTNNNAELSISYWSNTDKVTTHGTIGGLLIFIDNAFYLNVNNGINNYISSNDYFITGIFDTGSTETKSYTWYQAPKTVTSWPAFRLFNDLSAQSVDFWGASNASDQPPNTRTGSSPGRYILFSVRKDYAANTYLYDNTNQRYIFKGNNVI